MKILLLVLCSTVSMLGFARATVTLDFQAEVLRTSLATGATPILQSSLILILADTTQNGFGTLQAGSSIGINQLVAGTDDRIVGIFNATLWGENGVFQNPAFSPDLSSVTGWTAGDPLALVWLPTLNISSTSLTGGDSYGVFAPASPFSGSSGSDNWITPTDGNPGTFLFFTDTASTLGTGVFPSSSGQANLVVSAVPEPSRALLLLFGLGVCVLRRRRAAV